MFGQFIGPLQNSLCVGDIPYSDLIPIVGPIKRKRVIEAGAGAFVCMSPRLKFAIPQLPPEAHYALGGVAADALCRSSLVPSPTMETVYSAMAGVTGGMIYKFFY